MSPRRLEAEALRDAVLAVSGKLDLEPPVGSAVAAGGRGAGRPVPRVQPGRPGHAPGGLPAGGPRPGARVARPVRLRRPEPRHRRAGRPPAARPRRLYLMNSPFVIRQAEAAADRLRAVDGDDDRDRIEAGLSRGSSPGRRPTAERGRRPRRSSREFAAGRRREGRPGPRPHAPPGRPSARPSSPAPSSATSD